jgi:hypothetical protein
MTQRTIAFGALAIAVAACDGRVMDLGSNSGGETTGGYGSASSYQASTPAGSGAAQCSARPLADAGADDSAADAGASLEPLLGVWNGYVENVTFPSGSDVLTLTFASGSSGAIAGTITFGSGTPPAPPTDAYVEYMPSSSEIPGEPIEGFAYSVVAVQFDGTRLRFGAESLEPYKPWCELQTSYSWAPLDPCAYGCVPDWPGMGSTNPSNVCTLNNPSGGPSVTVNCGVFMFCSGLGPLGFVCDCSATGCTVSLEAPDTLFDMQLQPGRLDGSVLLRSSNDNVHFVLSGDDASL